jgi:O-succinylbenzoate synthase
MNLLLKGYYDMVDDCATNPDWIRKIEEEVGSSLAFMAIAMDESMRDGLVAHSPYFKRFVSYL